MPLYHYIPVPTWRDIIDILFLTLVAYQLYQWFRETRALRVLIGLAALGGIYSIAKLWGLFLTTWAFQFLWQVLLILLLILFQSEIRQVLEKVSPLRYLRSRRRVMRGALARQLTDVLFDLAAEKTGALIVLTRDDNPANVIVAGQKIMALPDPLLIKSIFNHHAPAHDGAVIMTRERLTHMGCILPLSKKEDIPEQYGTRHRAALGLCETTDAVCLVVSEERAEVASVVGDEIRTWKQPRELEKKLRQWLGGAEIEVPPAQKILKALFTENWKTKLGALALVSTAWLVLASHQQVTVTVPVEIRAVNMPTALLMETPSPRKVLLTLSGWQRQLNRLKDNKARVKVDLSRLAAGQHRLRLTNKNVEVPPGIRVERVFPQSIEINLKPAPEK